MTGGLMQLVAYGAQDIYLTGNPMITYFKVVYRRHTNFAMESIEQTFNGSVGFGKKVSALISRNGDLINGVYVEAVLPNILESSAACGSECRWVDDVGHHLIDTVDCEIGGQLIDRHYGDWLEIWAQLTVPAGKMRGYREMIGQDPVDALGQLTGLQGDVPGFHTNPGSTTAQATIPGRTIYVPLQFWFCRNVGLSLPLIALQYHEVKISVTFKARNKLIVNDTSLTGTTSELTASLWVDYIYLDTDERRRFAQVSHEYLIEQLQFPGSDADTCNASSTKALKLKLNFNHPVKELVWTVQFDQVVDIEHNQWSNYTTAFAGPDTGANGTGANFVDIAALTEFYPTATISGSQTAGYQASGGLTPVGPGANVGDQRAVRPARGRNPVLNAKLQLNGHDRFAQRQGSYFNWVQCFKHHTNVPESPGINVYSFALKPEEHQPSGTCNFSRIDNATLNLTIRDGRENDFGASAAFTIRVYAVNYNVLRIMSGMGGLAYSN